MAAQGGAVLLPVAPTTKGLVANLNDGYGASNLVPEPPKTFGSHQSRLVEPIRTAPCKSGLTREDFIRIVTWVDANAPYFGTHRGKKNLTWKDDPDFRPLPAGEVPKNNSEELSKH